SHYLIFFCSNIAVKPSNHSCQLAFKPSLHNMADSSHLLTKLLHLTDIIFQSLFFRSEKLTQLAECLYFEDKPRNQKDFKKQETPESLLIENNILKNFIGLLVKPKPFHKNKGSNLSQKQFPLRLFHKYGKIKLPKEEFQPQSIQYSNTLILDLNNGIKLQYILDGKLVTTQINFNMELSFQTQRDVIKLRDLTGIYQLEKQKQNIYARHLYSVEIFNNNYSSIDIVKSQDMIQQYLVSGNNLYLLTNDGIIQNDQNIMKQNINTKLPYRAISIHNAFDIRSLFVLSIGEMKLFDSRQKNLNSLISLEIDELVYNRFFTMHQFQNPQYVMASTNRNLQFYDLRNTTKPIFIQKHDTCINQFVPLTEPAKLLGLQELKNQKTKFKLSQQNDYVIGYNKNGPSNLIEFNSSCLQQHTDVKLIANLLADQTLQYQNQEMTQNGYPISVGNTSNLCKYLKIRGIQHIFYQNYLMIFSLDQQGGLCFSLFDKNMYPIKINQIKGMNNYLQVQDQQEVLLNLFQEEYDDIFNSEDLQDLQPIQDIRNNKKQFHKFPVFDKFDYDLGIKQQELNFEDMIMLEDKVPNQETTIPTNKQFILTQQIIDSLI
ncbi:hypothetical protein pb186bvf_005830, partial [Paramecium bursaria]